MRPSIPHGSHGSEKDWMAPSGWGRILTPRSTSPARKSKPTESPSWTGRCRPSTSCSEPLAEDTGSGADSTTVTPAPPSSLGRSTAIRGGSPGAIRFACTLAATSTPSSGACTAASRSANCTNPRLVPAGHVAHAKPSGAAEASGDPRVVEASARAAPSDSASTTAAASERSPSRGCMTSHSHEARDRVTGTAAACELRDAALAGPVRGWWWGRRVGCRLTVCRRGRRVGRRGRVGRSLPWCRRRRCRRRRSRR